jgi:hypothetical protein
MVFRDDAQTGGALTVKCCGTRWADSPECRVRFLELSLLFAIFLGKLCTQSSSLHMGQAKRRRERLGQKYGTREGSNKPKPCESLKIYRSAWTEKWAVGIKMPNGELTCLDVFYDRKIAELDASAAKSVLFNYDWPDLLSPEKWTLFINEYSKVSALMGVESDDECLMAVSETEITPNQVNAQLREVGLLSNNVWYRDAKQSES